jgi:simple sugar transport system permease protein
MASEDAVRRTSTDAGGGLRALALRPEFTAVVGTAAVFLFFAVFTGNAGFLSWPMTRNYLEIAASIGIIAAPVTLLLVAGEFDLSVGSVVAAGEVLMAYLIVFQGWPVGLAFLASMTVAALIGFLNGYLVHVTRLPSFIITLAMMFIIRGATQGTLRMAVGTSIIDRVRTVGAEDPVSVLFNASLGPFSISLLWWILATLVAAWVLDRTVFGNWIFASGGNQAAAVRTGIRVHRVKIILYMCTAMSAALVGALNVFEINQGNANAAVGREFEVVTAAVIGGALLSGGYGSPVGTFFGALLFGMVSQGFFFTPLPDVWFLTFLGGMLLGAVVLNNITRTKAMKPRDVRQ